MTKNYTEVIIDGKTYVLGGYEDDEYLQTIATYINTKLSELKKTDNFKRQPSDYRKIMLDLNIADDYYKLRHRLAELETEKKMLEKEVNDLKRELLGQDYHSKKGY